MAPCQTCEAEGFEPSLLGPHRCTFCDGTFGGHPPTAKDVAEAKDAEIAQLQEDLFHAEKARNKAEQLGLRHKRERDRLCREMSKARGQLFQGNTEAALGILGSALATDQPAQADGSWCVIKGEPKDSYPCLLWHQDWIDLDFNPTGVREGFWGPHPDDPDQECWIVARWNPCHDVWETERADPQPSHWKPMPAPPTDHPAQGGERASEASDPGLHFSEAMRARSVGPVRTMASHDPADEAERRERAKVDRCPNSGDCEIMTLPDPEDESELRFCLEHNRCWDQHGNERHGEDKG